MLNDKHNSSRRALRIVEQALLLMEMNYVHLPMKRAIHAIDPIQQLKLLRFQLAEWNVGLESTIDFHRRMLSIFGSTRDLHTLYLLPEPHRTAPRICHFSSNSVSSEAPNDSSSLGRRPAATRRRLRTMVMGPGSERGVEGWVGTASRL